MDIKWLKRYRLFCIGGSIILCIQIILAFVFFSIQEYSVVNELSPNVNYLYYFKVILIYFSSHFFIGIFVAIEDKKYS